MANQPIKTSSSNCDKFGSTQQIRVLISSKRSRYHQATKNLTSSSTSKIRVSECSLNEDEEIAASGLLMLANQDPWEIKKKLTESDLNAQSRLLIGANSVEQHILPYLDDVSREEISKDGLSVSVRDCDTKDVFKLKFKKWSSNSCVLNEGWRRDFVKRRCLKKDDIVGLFWSRIDNGFVFSVLERAAIDKSS